MVEKTATSGIWIVDLSGAKALVGNVDQWIPQGWKSAKAPTSEDMVWMQHSVHLGKALFASDAVPVWEKLGWEVSSPPTPVDVLHDQDLVDEPVAPAVEETPKKAASGSKKEQ
jgi:hypothetical protein